MTGALLLAAAVQAPADEIYRWVDDGGVVNYTQQKPRGVESQEITTGPERSTSRTTSEPSPVTPPPTGADGRPLNSEQRKMLEGLQAAEQARQSEIAKIKEQNCMQSRDILSRLTVKQRIRIRDESGQYRIMPEEERQERIQKAQEGIALYCTSASA